MIPFGNKKPGEEAAYRKLCTALAQKRTGLTIADMTASTALPLSQVREMLPRAADEFSANLAVTESGEIIYSFPRGFVSRYRGPAVFLKKLFGRLSKGLKTAGIFLFKIWIMVMLIGYFILFLAIAAASLVLSVAAQSKNSGSQRRGNVFMGPNIFNLIFRLWFYSELTRTYDRSYYPRSGEVKKKSRPLHRAIFSFIFGDGEPNKDWKNRENKALIAYIQANKGIISLPEFMAISGKDSNTASQELMTFCVEYGGSPEATEDGTIVYRFEDLLLRANRQDRSFAGVSPPIASLKKFSGNTKTMNICFGIINSVNLFFGSYFLFNVLNYGSFIIAEETKISSLYEFTYAMISVISVNPLPIVGIGLGLVPLVFSLLFWLIPVLRSYFSKKDNETIKLENLKRLGFNRIWSNPLAVKPADIDSEASECRPKKMDIAREKVIKDMGAYSVPEVTLNEKSETVYSFPELVREKQTLEKYRSSVKEEGLGSIVFDSRD